jgi:hypothetical protein
MDGDRMFCHACGGVWPKDHGLTCVHCQSEFTEIVRSIAVDLVLSYLVR